MQAPANGRHYARFGEFEVQFRQRELRANGVKVKLQDKPFQVLVILLEHAGELVNREEFRRRLWPEDTFVDFEHSVNVAVKKLREALGDSAEKPRFIETLPRHGYRFICPVDAGEDPGPTPTPDSSAVADRRTTLEAVREPPTRKRRLVSAASVVVAALVVALAGWFWSRGSRPAAPEAVATAVPLTTYFGTQCCPTFSPDGSQVAFAWNGEKEGSSNIYVKVIGVEPPLRLTANPANELSPAWSPDGRWIAFYRELPTGKAALMLTSPIPGPERTLMEAYLTPVSWGEELIAWSPDSRWLATVSAEKPGESCTLLLFSPETRERRRITSPPGGNWLGDGDPAFSPDGRTLAFSRWNAYEESDLYLINLSPGLEPAAKPRRLPLGIRSAASPAWTADGKSLVFAIHSGGGSTLWQVEVSGTSGPRHLATLGGHAYDPTTSRSGNRLAYAEVTQYESIWRLEIPPSGGKAKPPERFISSTRRDSMPEFSPDGRRIVFISDRSGSEEIWTTDADGRNLVQVTSLGGGTIGGEPHWSPDSRRLTFCTNFEGHYEVYVIDAGGGIPQRLTFSTYSANPSWSHDGKWIYFDSPARAAVDIYKVPAEGGRAVLVRRGSGAVFWGPRESPDGKFIYGIQDTAGRVSLARVPVAGGEQQVIVNSLPISCYALVADGIYFVSRPKPNSDYSIEFLSTATGAVRHIASFGSLVYHPAISPDRHWLLYTQGEGHTNLMLVENFH